MGSGKSKPKNLPPDAAAQSTHNRGQNVAKVMEKNAPSATPPTDPARSSVTSKNLPAPAAREAGDTALVFEAFRQVRALFFVRLVPLSFCACFCGKFDAGSDA